MPRTGKKSPPTPRPSIRRRPLHEDVADHLRALILKGHLPDGERIVEVDLCTRLDVSRTPLREALKTLAHEGLIEHLPNRGARVARVTPEGMRQLFEVISGLEMIAAEHVARAGKAAGLKRLRALHDRMALHHAAGERPEYFALNHQIHLRIVELSGNPVLAETHGALMVRARHFRYQALAGQDRWNEAMREHDALMAALESGDADAAGRIMKAHVQRTGEVVAASVTELSEPA